MKTYLAWSDNINSCKDLKRVRIDNDLAALISYIVWNCDFTDQKMIIASLQKNMETEKCKEDNA